MQQIEVNGWGDSHGLCIPWGLATALGFHNGDSLEAAHAEDGLLIRKKASKTYRLADIIDSFPSSDVAGEVDFGRPKGAEVW